MTPNAMIWKWSKQLLQKIRHTLNFSQINKCERSLSNRLAVFVICFCHLLFFSFHYCTHLAFSWSYQHLISTPRRIVLVTPSYNNHVALKAFSSFALLKRHLPRSKRSQRQITMIIFILFDCVWPNFQQLHSSRPQYVLVAPDIYVKSFNVLVASIF